MAVSLHPGIFGIERWQAAEAGLATPAERSPYHPLIYSLMLVAVIGAAVAVRGRGLAAVKIFRHGMRIRPNMVIYLDNRPVFPWGRLDAYHHEISQAYAEAIRGVASGTDDLAGAIASDSRLRRSVEVGLSNGDFRDTTRIRRWLEVVNRKIVAQGKKPLELVVAKAETDIDELVAAVVRRGERPAGVILGGSPKMLSETCRSDPVVVETLQLTDHLLREKIPTLGNCFGMHLMALSRYRALVEWIPSPDSPTGRAVIFGAHSITPRLHHPLLNPRKLASPVLQIHAQQLPFKRGPIPQTSVLAYSRHEGAGMIEALRCGPTAFATEFHPELSPRLLAVITRIQRVANWLKNGGCDVANIQAGLRQYHDTMPGGQLYGFDWVLRVLVPNYLT